MLLVSHTKSNGVEVLLQIGIVVEHLLVDPALVVQRRHFHGLLDSEFLRRRCLNGSCLHIRFLLCFPVGAPQLIDQFLQLLLLHFLYFGLGHRALLFFLRICPGLLGWVIEELPALLPSDLGELHSRPRRTNFKFHIRVICRILQLEMSVHRSMRARRSGRRLKVNSLRPLIYHRGGSTQLGIDRLPLGIVQRGGCISGLVRLLVPHFRVTSCHLDWRQLRQEADFVFLDHIRLQNLDLVINGVAPFSLVLQYGSEA